MNDIVERLRDFALPDDDLISEGIEEIEKLRERSDLLKELLAIIHRDGGHHTELVGLKQSWKDAKKKVPEAYGDIDDLRIKLNGQLSCFSEELAAYAHEAWSGWMKYMVSKIKFGSQRGLHGDGEVQIWLPNGLRSRWERQMNTPYHELPESEKESDRKEAEKMIEIMCSRGKETYR